jgi:hypothetical protein
MCDTPRQRWTGDYQEAFERLVESFLRCQRIAAVQF